MDKLQEIMAAKRKELEGRIRPIRPAELSRFASRKGFPSFRESLCRDSGLAVISEVKRKSPSAGAIATDLIASEQARTYYNSGTDAISVLTDEAYFGGTIKDLWEINDLLANRPDTPPTLRKDFFVHPIQVLEAAEAGAAAILIIVRALHDDEIRTLHEAARQAGLDALFEVHSLPEIERALTFDPAIIGVNNRDLSRFVTDLSLSEDLIPQLPEEIVAISESGIWDSEDAARVFEAGADAILVGEALMKMKDPGPFITACHGL